MQPISCKLDRAAFYVSLCSRIPGGTTHSPTCLLHGQSLLYRLAKLKQVGADSADWPLLAGLQFSSGLLKILKLQRQAKSGLGHSMPMAPIRWWDVFQSGDFNQMILDSQDRTTERLVWKSKNLVCTTCQILDLNESKSSFLEATDLESGCLF